MEQKKKNVIKKELPNINKADLILISKNFRNEYLSAENFSFFLEQSTLTVKLLFHIISDLRYHVHFTNYYQGPDNQIKLDLWNSEFVGNERTEISRVYNISTFLKNRDKEAMKKALEFLKLFMNKPYSFDNSQGKKITTSGGLLTNWFFAENSGNFEVIISQYWANKIVAIDYSNKFFMHLLDVFKNNKQLFFYLWVLDFKEFDLPDGTKIKRASKKVTTIQEDYNLNYKNVYDLIRFWLLPMKTKIDEKKLGVSFKYKVNEKNPNIIDFISFEQKPNKALSNGEISLNMITYKLSYLTRNYGLSNENKTFIKNLLKEDYYLFINKYNEFVKNCSKEKIYAKTYKGESFCNKIKSFYTL
ncbi:hypothetical protein [Flavobacterium sp.]|uniref:hypothetical protein n=1 Tax=Flavobacterium sp. TaxID=239 RepID=UPI0037515768